MNTKFIKKFMVVVLVFTMSELSFGRQAMDLVWSVDKGEQSDHVRFAPRIIQNNIIIDNDKNVYRVGMVVDHFTYVTYSKMNNNGYSAYSGRILYGMHETTNSGSVVDNKGNLFLTGAKSGVTINTMVDSDGNTVWHEEFILDSLNTGFSGTSVHILNDSTIAFTGKVSGKNVGYIDSYILLYDYEGRWFEYKVLEDLIGYRALEISSRADSRGNMYMYVDDLHNEE